MRLRQILPLLWCSLVPACYRTLPADTSLDAGATTSQCRSVVACRIEAVRRAELVSERYKRGCVCVWPHGHVSLAAARCRIVSSSNAPQSPLANTAMMMIQSAALQPQYDP